MASWINFGRGTLWITLLGASEEFENLLDYFFYYLKHIMLKQKKVMIYWWLNTQEVTKTYWDILSKCILYLDIVYLKGGNFALFPLEPLKQVYV